MPRARPLLPYPRETRSLIPLRAMLLPLDLVNDALAIHIKLDPLLQPPQPRLGAFVPGGIGLEQIVADLFAHFTHGDARLSIPSDAIRVHLLDGQLDTLKVPEGLPPYRYDLIIRRREASGQIRLDGDGLGVLEEGEGEVRVVEIRAQGFDRVA